MAKITLGPKVRVPEDWRRLYAMLFKAAKRQGLRWPTTTLYAHKWIKWGKRKIWASANTRRRGSTIHMVLSDEQAEHTMVHELAHVITHLAYRPKRRHGDEHPPLFWSIHGMLYASFIDGR